VTDTALVDELEIDDTGRNGLVVLVENKLTVRVPPNVPPRKHKLKVVIVTALAALAWNSMAARAFGENIVIGEPGEALQPLPILTSVTHSVSARKRIIIEIQYSSLSIMLVNRNLFYSESTRESPSRPR